MSPTSASAGGAGFNLTVNGTNFVAGSVVRWNGASRTTTFVSATQLRAAITAADIATAGTASVTVFNPTPGGGASSALTFTVNAAAVAPTITTTSLPAGTVNTAYIQALAATGGTTPYAWSLASGTPPAGLSLSASGVISGTPTTAGSSTFTVRVTGANSASSTQGLTLTINAANVAGPMTVSPATGLSSTGASGGPFTPSSQTYTVTNTGSASMNWTASKAATWVTLSATGGTLAAGTSTTVTASINSSANTLAASSTNYTDTVTFTNTTNGNGNTTRAVSLRVNAAAASLTSIAVSGPATVNEGGTGTFTATGTWDNGTTAAIAPTWSENSTFATITSGGVLTASAVTANQTVTVTASFGGRTGERSVTIVDAAESGGVTVVPAEGADDVPVNTVVSGTLTGTGNIASIFNAQTFTLKVNGPEPPESKCMGDDGIVRGAISYNASNTAGTFTPACPLTNGTAYTATIASSTGGLSAAKTWGFTTIPASVDTDADGVPDNEDDHPGHKGKGTPPSSRGHGKFLVDVTATAGASLAFAEGMAETDASLNQAGMPAGYEFPDGLVSYQVIDVAPGGTATVKVTFPSGIAAGSKVYKVGAAGFQEFAGATIQGNTVTLILTDGGTGDRDGLANGVIVDPVGVAVPVASGTGSIDLSSASGGGGCSVAVRTGSGGSYIDGTLILAGLGMTVWGIRIRRRRR